MNILVCDDNKRDLQNAKRRIEQFGKEQYVEDGNLYYNKMEEDDKVQVLKR